MYIKNRHCRLSRRVFLKLLCSFGFDLLSFCQTEIKPRPAMTAAEYQKLHNAYRECLNPFSMAITDAFVFLGFKEHQEVFSFP